MKIRNVLILLAAIYVGLFVVPGHIFVKPMKDSEQSYFVTPERETQIRELLSKELTEGNRVCVYEGPFPFNPRETHRGCERCEDLERAELVKKTIKEYQDNGELKFDAQYDLTTLGKAVYSDAKDAQGRGLPRFCFGTTALHSIESIRYGKLLNNPGAPAFGVQYIAEIQNPNPLLFDPRIKALKMALPPAPEHGQPALYPVEAVTMYYSYGQMNIDY